MMTKFPIRTQIALALGIGLMFGAAAKVAGLPLPWMLGPMIGTTFAALMRLPVKGPNRLQPFVVPVIGVFLGSGFTPHLFSQIGDWTITLLMLPAFIVTSAAIGFMLLRHFGDYDRVTAFFAAVPGGLTDMMLIGEANGGDGRRIALAHAVRIFVVISCVALFFGLALGVQSSGGQGRPYTRFQDLALRDDLLFLACAVFGAGLGRLLRLPAPNMLGPMILSAALHLTEVMVVQPPSILVIMAQWMIGTIIGCRFAGTALAEVGRDIWLATLSSLAMIGVALVFALLIQWVTGTDLSQAFLAYSPGGLTEMSLLAFAMGQEVAYVSVAHIARIVLVIFGTPLVFRLLGWRTNRSNTNLKPPG